MFNEKELVRIISERLGKEVKFDEVVKNNGTVLKGIVVPDDGPIGKVVYVPENMYDKSEEAIAEKIIATIEDTPDKEFDVAKILSKEFIKENCFIQLVNRVRNLHHIDKCPTREILDLLIIVRVMVEKTDEGIATFIMDNEKMKLLDITEEELIDLAIKNSERILGSNIIKLSEMVGLGAGLPVRVLYTEDMMHGAGAIIYSNKVRELALELGQDIIIIPSSIHETLLVPEDCMESSDILEMVRTVNATSLDEEDILSNNIYRYSLKDNTLTLIEE